MLHQVYGDMSYVHHRLTWVRHKLQLAAMAETPLFSSQIPASVGCPDLEESQLGLLSIHAAHLLRFGAPPPCLVTYGDSRDD